MHSTHTAILCRIQLKQQTILISRKRFETFSFLSAFELRCVHMGREPHPPPGGDSKTEGSVKFGAFVYMFYFGFFAYKYFLSNVLILKQTKVVKFTRHQSTQERMVSSLHRHVLWSSMHCDERIHRREVVPYPWICILPSLWRWYCDSDARFLIGSGALGARHVDNTHTGARRQNCLVFDLGQIITYLSNSFLIPERRSSNSVPFIVLSGR